MSFLKKKIFGTDLERAERERDRENLRVVREQAIYKGRVAGAAKAGYQEGFRLEQRGGQKSTPKRVGGGIVAAGNWLFHNVEAGPAFRNDPFFGTPSQRQPRRSSGKKQSHKRKKRRSSSQGYPFF